MQAPRAVIIRDIFRDLLGAISSGSICAVLLKAFFTLLPLGISATGIGAIVLGGGILIGVLSAAVYNHRAYKQRQLLFVQVAEQMAKLDKRLLELNRELQKEVADQNEDIKTLAQKTARSSTEIYTESEGDWPEVPIVTVGDLRKKQSKKPTLWEGFKRFIGVSHEIFSDIVVAENVTELDMSGKISPRGMSLIVLIAGVITCCLYPILKRAKQMERDQIERYNTVVTAYNQIRVQKLRRQAIGKRLKTQLRAHDQQETINGQSQALKKQRQEIGRYRALLESQAPSLQKSPPSDCRLPKSRQRARSFSCFSGLRIWLALQLSVPSAEALFNTVPILIS